MPLLVRAGSILPLGPLKQYTTESVEAPLTVQVYPGADGAFTLYEDDGSTFDYRRGEWMGTLVRWDDRRRRLSMRLADGSRMRPPPARPMEVRLVGSSVVRAVTFRGAPLDIDV
jgi:hypothetical protein